MPVTAAITTALETAEDAILAVLRAIPAGAQETPAFWYVADAGTVGRLQLNADHQDHIPWCLVAQHQDGGGAPAHRIGAAGWAGLVVIRCLSATDANARLGYAMAAAAILDATSPTGLRVSATFDRPIAVPPLDLIHTRAGQWRVTIRRTAGGSAGSPTYGPPCAR